MQEKRKKSEFNIDINEIAEAGLHFGHRTSRTHPNMKPYISGSKSSIHIIDIEKTAEKLEEVLGIIRKTISEGKVLLLVGTKVQSKELVKSTAQECNIPYIYDRWLGGTFTNFETIKKRIEHYKDLKKKKDLGEFNKYTKKERAKMGTELKKLEVKFGGIENMTKIPDAIFVLDLIKDKLAVKEAKDKGVIVIGIADTNTNPLKTDYFVPANDDALSSIKYILGKIKETILDIKSI